MTTYSNYLFYGLSLFDNKAIIYKNFMLNNGTSHFPPIPVFVTVIISVQVLLDPRTKYILRHLRA